MIGKNEAIRDGARSLDRARKIIRQATDLATAATGALAANNAARRIQKHANTVLAEIRRGAHPTKM